MADYYANLDNNYRLRLWVGTQSQNVGGNSSRAVFSLVLEKIGSYTRWSGYTTNSWSVTVNGSTYSGNTSYDFRNYSELTLLNSQTLDVAHNADGSKSVSVSASWNDAVNAIPDGSLSGTYTFASIPRASSPRLSQSHTNAGGAVTIYTDRASTGFTHEIQVFFGSIGTSIVSNVTDSYVWNIPITYLNEMPNTDRMFGTIRLRTFSGSTDLGYKDTAFAVTTPASAVPTITSVTATEATAGLNANVGKFVQNVTTLAVATSGAAGVYGSTIASTKIEVAGQTISAASGTTAPINASGTVNVVATVTDTRGKTGTKTLAISVLPYSAPQIIGLEVYRSTSGGVAQEDGTYVTVKFTAAVSSLMNTTERNARSYQIRSLDRTTNTWTVKQAFLAVAGTSSLITRYLTTYAAENSFDFEIAVKDDFMTSTAVRTVSVAKVFMHWNGSLGLGLGKYHTQGALDVEGDGYFSGALFQGAAKNQVLDTRHWGTVANYAALPATGNTIGDQRLALDTGVIFMWNGTAWRATQTGVVPYLRAASGDLTRANTDTGDVYYSSASMRGGFVRSGNAFVVPPGCGGIYSLNATARSFNQSLNVFIRLYVNGVMIANITSGGQEGIHISHEYGEIADGMTLSVRIFPYTGSTGVGDLVFSATRVGG